jgi:hypothetical protein
MHYLGSVGNQRFSESLNHACTHFRSGKYGGALEGYGSGYIKDWRQRSLSEPLDPFWGTLSTGQPNYRSDDPKTQNGSGSVLAIVP